MVNHHPAEDILTGGEEELLTEVHFIHTAVPNCILLLSIIILVDPKGIDPNWNLSSGLKRHPTGSSMVILHRAS